MCVGFAWTTAKSVCRPIIHIVEDFSIATFGQITFELDTKIWSLDIWGKNMEGACTLAR